MFFSVIIPVYNVAKYLPRGFNSLKSQTFTDFEIIFVDDGSTDSSGEICDNIAASNPHITVIHKKNEGSGPARNTGMEAAQGQYLLFFDIDDLLKPSAFERLHKELVEYTTDILVFGYEEVNPRLKLKSEYRFPDLSCHDNGKIRAVYPEYLSGIKFNNGFVWNKVYRREFIKENGLRFEPLRIQQDEVFNLAVYPKASSLRTIPDILYTYFIYDSGNTRSRYIPERLDIYRRVHEAFLSLYSHWHLEDTALLQFIHLRFFDSVIYHINYNVFHPDNGLTPDRRRNAILDIMQAPDTRRMLQALEDICLIQSRHRNGYFKAMQTQSVPDYIRLVRKERIIKRLKNIARKILPR